MSLDEAVESSLLPARVLGLCPLREIEGRYCSAPVEVCLSLVAGTGCAALAVYLALAGGPPADEVRLGSLIEHLKQVLLSAASLACLADVLRSQAQLQKCRVAFSQVCQAVRRHRPLGVSPWRRYSGPLCLLSALLLGGALKSWVFTWDTLNHLFNTFLLARVFCTVQRLDGLLAVSSALIDSLAREVSSSHQLGSLAVAYHNLVAAVSSFADRQMPHVLLVVLTSFVIVVSQSYKVCVFLKGPLDTSLYLLVLNKISWICACASILWRIASACGHCTKQV